MHPYYHAESSAKKHGGNWKDYIDIHSWFDQSKAGFGDVRHRAMLHHTEGIFLCEKFFGVTITNSDDKIVPVRFIGEQHVKEDLGWIPSMKDWMECIRQEKWMIFTPRKIIESSGTINLTDDEVTIKRDQPAI